MNQETVNRNMKEEYERGKRKEEKEEKKIPAVNLEGRCKSSQEWANSQYYFSQIAFCEV
jgi:hypothetical protein